MCKLNLSSARHSRHPLRTRFASERGAEFIEFALTLPFLLLIVLGILDFGTLFQQYEVLENAAREGARVAVLSGFSDAAVEARVQAYIDASALSGTGSLTVPAPTRQNLAISAGNCMSAVTVTVQYTHPFPFLGGIMQYFGATLGTKTMTASATMRTAIAATAC